MNSGAEGGGDEDHRGGDGRPRGERDGRSGRDALSRRDAGTRLDNERLDDASLDWTRLDGKLLNATLLEAVSHRRSHSRVTEDAPTRAELLPLVTAAATVADHGSLRPWRLIELRGDARGRLGAALAASAGLTGSDVTKLAGKPLRAPLLIAIVAVRRPSAKVAQWEQDAAAAGVAHVLSLLLHEMGWGVMWRTGPHVRSAEVRNMHGLADNEDLLGWLYVGGRPESAKPDKRSGFDADGALSTL